MITHMFTVEVRAYAFSGIVPSYALSEYARMRFAELARSHLAPHSISAASKMRSGL